MAVWRFDAIGTSWEIETRDPLPDAVRRAVASLIDAFDREWSRFRDDSLVSALARGAGSAPAPRDAAEFVEVFAALSDARTAR